MNPPVNPNVKFTYEDYLSLGLDDQRRYEIIAGEIYVAPSPTVRHQLVSKRIHDALTHYVQAHALGIVFYAPLDVLLSETNIVQPDILYIRTDRMGIIQDPYIKGPPDLLVEVVSPGNANHDRKLKRSAYSRYGVREYWIVDPVACTIEQLVYSEDGLRSVGVFPQDGKVTARAIPGFAIDLAPVFAPLQ